MDFLFLLFCIGILVLLGFLVCVCVLDSDLTTAYCDKYGKDVNKELNGKVIWITGASTGIGAALAEEAAPTGARLVLTARSQPLLQEVRSRCISLGSKAEDILILPMDLTDFNCHQSSYDKVVERFGRVDIFLHNAGRSQRARWEHTHIDVDRDLFNLNVFSIVNLTRLVLPAMLKAGSGTIALMSSAAGKSGVPFSGTYTGSKHALHGYFESLRNEKVGQGVEVCMLCPGPTFSNLLQIAATEKPNEVFGEAMKSTDKRMTAQRCARLSFVAIVNKIPESWISFFPVLPLMYCNQYLPSISQTLMKLLGPRFLANVRDSRNAMESNKLK